jgi:hypothetical protein
VTVRVGHISPAASTPSGSILFYYSLTLLGGLPFALFEVPFVDHFRGILHWSHLPEQKNCVAVYRDASLFEGTGLPG